MISKCTNNKKSPGLLLNYRVSILVLLHKLTEETIIATPSYVLAMGRITNNFLHLCFQYRSYSYSVEFSESHSSLPSLKVSVPLPRLLKSHPGSVFGPNKRQQLATTYSTLFTVITANREQYFYYYYYTLYNFLTRKKRVMCCELNYNM